MSNISYLKGVRTRFRNILQRKIDKGNDLLQCELENCDIEKAVAESSKCIQILKVYCEKLELQSEKLSTVAIEESDQNLIEQICEEDSVLCSEAIELSINLQQQKEMLLNEKGKREMKPTTHQTSVESRSDELITLQKDMQRIMELQIQQQDKLMDIQTNKGKQTTMKLPKLDLISFGGDKTKWCEFWDSFKCSVHENRTLSNSEKFNYLRSKVYGEAQRAISGLALSDGNYDLAIGILKERFGNVQEVIDLHYNKLINLYPASNKTASLRTLLDTVEKHLRSLEVLEQNIDQAVFVSMIRAKLPEDVLVQLEILNGANNKWTIWKLRDRLREYIFARERAEKKEREFDKKSRDSKPVQSGYKRNTPTTQPSQKHYTNSAYVLTANRPIAKQPFLNKSSENYADKCRYCQQRHWSDECLKYRTISERKQQLKDSCYKCLKKGHQSSECRRGKMCTHCGEVNRHHRSLCPTKFKLKESMTQLANEILEDQETPISEENVLVSSNEMVLMQTATTDIKNPNTSDSLSVRLLLDSGSHRTYITEKLAHKLHLKETGEQEIRLVTFGSTNTQLIKTKCANIDVKLKNGAYIQICVNIVPTISGHLHRNPVSVLEKEQMKHIIGSVDLADTLPTENESSSIEMLVGNDYYLDFILCQRIELHPGLFLLGSKLGWILTGRTSDQINDGPCMFIMTQANSVTNTSLFANVDSVIPIKPSLEDFWNVEFIGIIDKRNVSEDEIAMKMFLDTIQFENGRYQVIWPWAEEFPDLPINKELAICRLKSCVNKLKGKPELMTKYDAVINDQLDKGVIEKVEKSVTDTNLVHYLPHHAVITPQKTTTKLRVVYDASARTKKENKSLNDCLYRGPVMLQDLCGMLLRFRMQSIAVVAEIEKAFLQIGLQPNQRDVTRFLWLKDCENPSVVMENIQEFRFCRVPFGVISSPFLLGAVVDFHLKCYDDPVAEKLRNNIYVDNVITGAENTGEAIELYTKSKSMFEEASMNLREWVTNSDLVNEYIPKEDRADIDIVKVLGHQLNTKEDTIMVTSPKLKSNQSEWTKRTILKNIASVFDPLGLISPVLLRGKLLVQSLWKRNFDWDDNLTTEDQTNWSSVLSDIDDIESFQIPRYVCELPKANAKYTLLCFCDASEAAYSTVIYIHVSENHKSIVNVVFAKTRLAPVKKMTIPRLELLAEVIGLRCLKFVREQLRVPVTEQYLWTDSKCVLQWITSEKKLPVFVRNRVNEIKEHNAVKFAYIPTKENPADIASRGTTLKLLATDSSWWHGPYWLMKSSLEWPVYSKNLHDNSDIVSEEEDPNQENNRETMFLQPEANQERSAKSPPFNIDSYKFSSITKLFRVTALVLRFLRRLKKVDNKCGPIESTELLEAERMWLRYVQDHHFQSDIISIKSESKHSNRKQQLGLFLDKHGLLRCTGRLEHASLSEGTRQPILLPRNDRLTELIIEKTHKDILHSGVSQTLAKTRQRFWIVRGRTTVKTVLNKCVVCRRHEGGSYKSPPMSSLPKSRVTESTPFSRIGLDYFGPIFLKTTGEDKKAWICLFTCFVTRAVHLELVSDMSTDEFLMCFRRFIAQRGTPVQIASDNAKQFKAASSILDTIWHDILHSDEVQSYVASTNIKWNFIIELAPWMGGFYERLVGLVKRSFRKAVGRKLLTLIQVQTLIKEIEAVVNSRPLVYVGDDLNSTIALTPSHFLTLNPQIGIPEIPVENDHDYLPKENPSDKLLSVWKKGQSLLDKFWQLWKDEYLVSLRERMQTRLKTSRIQSPMNPNVGDIVILKENNTPRGSWKLAKIEELNFSRDGEIRSCKVKLSSRLILNRPMSLLFPVETSHEIGIQQEKSTENDTKSAC